jgi:predicted peroxiredoxin
MEDRLVYIITHAKDNLEMAAIPFKLVGGALAMDVVPVVILQGEGVNLAVKGYLSDDNPHEKEIKNAINMYLSFGNQIYLCSPCLKERNITDDMIIEGAVTVGAAKVTEEVLKAKNVLKY